MKRGCSWTSRLNNSIDAQLRLLLRMRHFHPRIILALSLTLGLAALFWPVRGLRSENFVFYFPSSRHVVSLSVIENTRYLPLLQVLNLVGTVSGLQQKRSSLKLRMGESKLELRIGERKARSNKVQLNLSAPPRVVNGQVMVPVDFLTSVLPELTQQPIEHQLGTDRAFIGNVKPISFTVRLDRVSKGARLSLQFTDKITMQTAATNGKWVVYLGTQPVKPPAQAYHFQDPYLTGLQFDDQDGVPKLILTPTSGGLDFYPTLSEEGKVLVAEVLQPAAVTALQSQAPQQPGTASTPRAGAPTSAGPTGPEQLAATPASPPLPVVVLDAGHGGQDAGARSSDGVLEKNLVAQLVDRVRIALLATKKYRIVLTRTGDADPSFDERDVLANLARPDAFLTFHAGDLGAQSPKIMEYTCPPLSPSAAHGEVYPTFAPWKWAQQAHLERSRRLAGLLQQHFAQIPGLGANNPDEAPVRQLRSVDAPAVAIEIGTLSAAADATSLTDSTLQERISEAVVQALAAFHEGSS